MKENGIKQKLREVGLRQDPEQVREIVEKLLEGRSKYDLYTDTSPDRKAPKATIDKVARLLNEGRLTFLTQDAQGQPKTRLSMLQGLWDLDAASRWRFALDLAWEQGKRWPDEYAYRLLKRYEALGLGPYLTQGGVLTRAVGAAVMAAGTVGMPKVKQPRNSISWRACVVGFPILSALLPCPAFAQIAGVMETAKPWEGRDSRRRYHARINPLISRLRDELVEWAFSEYRYTPFVEDLFRDLLKQLPDVDKRKLLLDWLLLQLIVRLDKRKE